MAFHMIRFLAWLFFIAALGLSSGAIAAGHVATATGRATATIVAPIRLEGISQLDFGLLLPGSRNGTVKITPTARREIAGPVSMFPGLYTPASFSVIGRPNAAYAVTTPSSLMFQADGLLVDIFDTRGKTSSLVVKDFTTYSLNLRGGDHRGLLGNRGQDLLTVGGTLIVPANAAPGRYRGLVPISVAYQ